MRALLGSIQGSCQTSLWLCMITRCLPPFNPCTARRMMLQAYIMLGGGVRGELPSTAAAAPFFCGKTLEDKNLKSINKKKCNAAPLGKIRDCQPSLCQFGKVKNKENLPQFFWNQMKPLSKINYVELAFRGRQCTMICSCNHYRTASIKSQHPDLATPRTHWIKRKLLGNSNLESSVNPDH